MATPPRPLGQRFTHVYIERGPPLEDSPRVRRRIAALIDSIRDLEELATSVPRELGVEMIWSGYGPNWPDFLARLGIRDFLDLITLAFRELQRKKRTGLREIRAPEQWIAEVRRVFTEQNFAYTVDDAGGVHYALDEEFARGRAATIAALQAPRYSNALDGFTRGMAALAGAPPDGKGAIRSVFAALEGLFRLMVPEAPRLAADQLQALCAHLNCIFADDATALRSSTKMLNSLKDWTDAAHFYRHEEGAEEVAQPPLTLAVYLVSTGAAHLRWLAEVDAKLNGQ